MSTYLKLTYGSIFYGQNYILCWATVIWGVLLTLQVSPCSVSILKALKSFNKPTRFYFVYGLFFPIKYTIHMDNCLPSLCPTFIGREVFKVFGPIVQHSCVLPGVLLM